MKVCQLWVDLVWLQADHSKLIVLKQCIKDCDTLMLIISEIFQHTVSYARHCKVQYFCLVEYRA